MKRAYRIVLAALIMATSGGAAAQDWGPIDAKVTLIDAGVMGQTSPYAAFYFIVDTQVGSATCSSTGVCCAAGTYLVYVPRSFSGSGIEEITKQMTNSRAALSAAQLSIVTGYKLRLYGYNKAAGTCQVSYILQLNQ